MKRNLKILIFINTAFLVTFIFAHSPTQASASAAAAMGGAAGAGAPETEGDYVENMAAQYAFQTLHRTKEAQGNVKDADGKTPKYADDAKFTATYAKDFAAHWKGLRDGICTVQEIINTRKFISKQGGILFLPKTPSATPRPLIVHLHGGGEDQQFTTDTFNVPVYEFLVQGFAVFAPFYSLLEEVKLLASLKFLDKQNEENPLEIDTKNFFLNGFCSGAGIAKKFIPWLNEDNAAIAHKNKETIQAALGNSRSFSLIHPTYRILGIHLNVTKNKHTLPELGFLSQQITCPTFFSIGDDDDAVADENTPEAKRKAVLRNLRYAQLLLLRAQAVDVHVMEKGTHHMVDRDLIRPGDLLEQGETFAEKLALFTQDKSKTLGYQSLRTYIRHKQSVWAYFKDLHAKAHRAAHNDFIEQIIQHAQGTGSLSPFFESESIKHQLQTLLLIPSAFSERMTAVCSRNMDTIEQKELGSSGTSMLSTELHNLLTSFRHAHRFEQDPNGNPLATLPELPTQGVFEPTAIAARIHAIAPELPSFTTPHAAGAARLLATVKEHYDRMMGYPFLEVYNDQHTQELPKTALTIDGTEPTFYLNEYSGNKEPLTLEDATEALAKRVSKAENRYLTQLGIDVIPAYHAAPPEIAALYALNSILDILGGRATVSNLTQVRNAGAFPQGKTMADHLEHYDALGKSPDQTHGKISYNNNDGFNSHFLAASPWIHGGRGIRGASPLDFFNEAKTGKSINFKERLYVILTEHGISTTPERLEHYTFLAQTCPKVLLQIFMTKEFFEQNAYLCEMWGERLAPLAGRNGTTFLQQIRENPCDAVPAFDIDHGAAFTNPRGDRELKDTGGNTATNFLQSVQMRIFADPKAMEQGTVIFPHALRQSDHDRFMHNMAQLVMEDKADDEGMEGIQSVISAILTEDNAGLSEMGLNAASLTAEVDDPFAGTEGGKTTLFEIALKRASPQVVVEFLKLVRDKANDLVIKHKNRLVQLYERNDSVVLFEAVCTALKQGATTDSSAAGAAEEDTKQSYESFIRDQSEIHFEGKVKGYYDSFLLRHRLNVANALFDKLMALDFKEIGKESPIDTMNL